VKKKPDKKRQTKPRQVDFVRAPDPYVSLPPPAFVKLGPSSVFSVRVKILGNQFTELAWKHLVGIGPHIGIIGSAQAVSHDTVNIVAPSSLKTDGWNGGVDKTAIIAAVNKHYGSKFAEECVEILDVTHMVTLGRTVAIIQQD